MLLRERSNLHSALNPSTDLIQLASSAKVSQNLLGTG